MREGGKTGKRPHFEKSAKKFDRRNFTFLISQLAEKFLLWRPRPKTFWAQKAPFLSHESIYWCSCKNLIAQRGLKLNSLRP